MGKGWESADDWAALAAAAIIIYNAWRIFRPALADIMDEDRFDELRQRIEAVAIAEPGVHAVPECLVRKLGSEYHIDLRLLVGKGQTIETLCALKRRLRSHLHAQEAHICRIFIECDCCERCPHDED